MAKKPMVSVFVVNKRTRIICCSTKDSVIKSLMSMGIKARRVIKGTIIMWDVLLHSAQDCLEIAKRELITKNLILRTEYESPPKKYCSI